MEADEGQLAAALEWMESLDQRVRIELIKKLIRESKSRDVGFQVTC